MPARRPIGLVVDDSAGRNLFQRGKSGGGIARLRDGNSSADERTDSGRNFHQPLIKQNNLRPVDAATDSPTIVNGLNGRLQLIASHLFERCSRPQMFLRL